MTVNDTSQNYLRFIFVACLEKKKQQQQDKNKKTTKKDNNSLRVIFKICTCAQITL